MLHGGDLVDSERASSAEQPGQGGPRSSGLGCPSLVACLTIKAKRYRNPSLAFGPGLGVILARRMSEA